MDDAAAVQIGQRTQHLRHEPYPLWNRARARVLGERTRRVEQRHREIRHLVAVEAVVQDADDVGMPQRGQGLELPGERRAIVERRAGIARTPT